MKRLAFFGFVVLSCPVFGGDIVVNQFGGLNTQDNPAAIRPYQSQDLLNVNLQPGGGSVFKRDGYGLFQNLNSISTAAVHGGYHFQQTGGGDVQLWGSDTHLYASLNDASFVAIATGTVGATWQCTDNLGFAYCLDNSAVDTAIKTDGSLANTTFQPTIPLGTTITSTPLQLVVAGVSANPSSIYVSANNNFTNFTTGPLPTDPYIEIINAPGSRIIHVAYYFGKLFWWKDQSFGYLSGSANQNTVGITIISNQIGTLDNSSAFWNSTNYDAQNNFSAGTNTTSQGNPYFNEASSLGGIFFRGQDNHIYQYDGYTLTRLSRIITPTITVSGRRKANSWLQTTQANFNAGSIVPTSNLSTSISPGDVIVSNSQGVENSPVQWNQGTATNLAINATSLTLLTNNLGNITNPDFESAFSGNWTGAASLIRANGTDGNGLPCNLGPKSGSFWLKYVGTTGSSSQLFEATDLAGNVLQSQGIGLTNDCVWRQNSLTPTSQNIGKRVKFQFHVVEGGNFYATTSDSYIWGGPISFWFASNLSASSLQNYHFDNVTLGSSTIASGVYTSSVYNQGFTSSTFQLQSNFTANTSTPTFALFTSTAATGPWTTLLTSTGTNAVGNQYAYYSSTIPIGGLDNAFTSINSVTILSRSTGTYYSAVNNAPNLSSWGSFTVDDFYPGISSITYYTRASTNSFTILSSTPTWVLQTKNTAVSASTGTYMQGRADFSLSAATETPVLNDFSFNWFEGTAGDKAYIQYFQDALWFSVSSGSTTSKNNTILYLDLLNNAWLKYNIAANGFVVENNALYIGDPLAGRVHKYGNVQTDNGVAIQSYWKSKDFTGEDPTVQNEFQQADFSFGQSSTTVSYTYDLDQSASMLTAVNLSLYSTKNSIVKRGLLLAKGKIGTYYNFQVGDNSSQPKWVLMGHRVHYNPLNWSPQTSQ